PAARSPAGGPPPTVDGSFCLVPSPVAQRPRVALVPQLEPTSAWRGTAERYAVVDERAAAALIARGVFVERIVVTGWPQPAAWREAANAGRDELRSRFDLAVAPGS